MAELSGNGTRIAARWLAERSGRDEVTIRVGRPRRARRRCSPSGEIEQDIGAVEVYEPGARRGARRSCPVSVGNPHAVVVGDPDDLPLIGPLLETHPRFPDRTNVQVVRVDAPGRVTRAGLGAGGGGDPVVRNERGGGRRRNPRRTGTSVVDLPRRSDSIVRLRDGRATLTRAGRSASKTTDPTAELDVVRAPVSARDRHRHVTRRRATLAIPTRRHPRVGGG